MKLSHNQNRNSELDFLKGIAIIAVVLYHFVGSVLPFGYLGVEIFFVISGYLLMNSMLRAIKAGEFSFLKQISNRILRLFPTVLAVASLAFIVGFFVMLPDDFENLAQSIIASSSFLNNVLAAITTKNYWDVVNLFKPLMHTWYLGVLIQAYIVIVGTTAICNKFAKNKLAVLKWLMLIMTVISLALYLTPSFSQESKFYYLPFRLFEITAGSFIALTVDPQKGKCKPLLATIVKTVCVFVILAIITINSTALPSELKLLATVVFTIIYTYFALVSPMPSVLAFKPLEFLGRNSFPIYISHQCVVAFFYYSFIYKVSITAFLVFLLVVALFSVLIHFLVEKPTDRLLKLKRQKTLWIVCVLIAVVLCGASGLVYLNAGVVRDVPELDISTQNTYRGMHAAYCDVPYSWDKDFTDSDKVNVLVIGDSFGRDWANILNESAISEEIEISYIFIGSSDYTEKTLQRVKDADIVFDGTSSLSGVSPFILENIPEEKLWIVGYKNFGNSNGYIYKSRFAPDYHTKTQTISDSILSYNNELKETYQSHYIDMLGVVLQDGNQVRVFTDNGRFISQDCRHLTKAGAQFYANKLDLSWIAEFSS